MTGLWRWVMVATAGLAGAVVSVAYSVGRYTP